MLGELNAGWTVGKRLLQHERQSQTGATAGHGRRGKQNPLRDPTPKEYVGRRRRRPTRRRGPAQRVWHRHMMDAKAHSADAWRAGHRRGARQRQGERGGVDPQERGLKRVAQQRGRADRRDSWVTTASDGKATASSCRRAGGRARPGCPARRCRSTAAPSRSRTTSSRRTFSVFPENDPAGLIDMAALTEEQALIKEQAQTWAREEAPVARSFARCGTAAMSTGFDKATWDEHWRAGLGGDRRSRGPGRRRHGPPHLWHRARGVGPTSSPRHRCSPRVSPAPATLVLVLGMKRRTEAGVAAAHRRGQRPS